MKRLFFPLLMLIAACGSSETGASKSGAPAAPTSTGANAGSTQPTVDGGSGGSDGGAGVPYPAPDWPTATPEEEGLSTSGLDAAAAVASENQSYCLLVVRHGMLVYEKYWGGTDATTKNKSWSLAKSYTSTVVGIAIDRGDIASIDESVSDFVPEWKGSDRESITIRDLVSMTGGLKWDVTEDYVGMALLAQDDTSYAIDRPLASPAGSTWTYDNGGVQVLERVFRNATGGTIEAYAQAHLWGPLGMDATWAHDPDGNPTAYANVLASCRDHARLGYLYLHGGTWAGGLEVLSSSWVKDTITPSQAMNRAYGYLWWLNGGTPAVDAMGQAWSGQMVAFAPADLFAARGFGNQFIDVIPSLDMMVIRFGLDPETGFDPVKLATDSHFGVHDQILQPVLAAITGP